MKVLKFLLFNPLTKAYLFNDRIQKLDFNKRLKAMGLELLYVLSVFIPLILPFFILNQLLQDTHVGQRIPSEVQFTDLIIYVPASLLYVALFNKDFYKGQSIVHRLLGYQIIDATTMMPANRLRCMLRNVTAPIWPIEGLVTLFNPQRRIGDLIAGTKILEVGMSDPELIMDEIRVTNYDLMSILALILPLVLMMLLFLLT